MTETANVLAGWLAFGGSHLFLSHGDIRAGLRRRLGAYGFLGLYSLVALAAFYFLVTAYFYHRHAGPMLWDLRFSSPAKRVVEALNLVAFFLMIASFIAPSPTAMDPRARHEARGLLRITRHPFLMGAALLGVSHCIVNGYASDLAFFGGLAAFAIAGAFHQDARKRREASPEQRAFFEKTSVLPFAAILRGQQSLRLGELPWIPGLIGIAIALVIRWYHARWFGVPIL